MIDCPSPLTPLLEGEGNIIYPNWPASGRVKAVVTTRAMGDMRDPAVRSGLQKALGLPGEPVWLRQVHGTAVADLDASLDSVEADAAKTSTPGRVCAVLTADCIPLLICNKAGTEVAAIHAGWKGLAIGAIEAGIAAMDSSPEDLLVWMGPCISREAFECRDDVRDLFLANDADAACHFSPFKDRYLGDTVAIAKQRLQKKGITDIYGGEICTYNNGHDFFSHRRFTHGRDQEAGRMASLIWLE